MFTTPTHKNTPQRWVKVAVDYYRNPKIITVGIYAELAYLRLLAIARERVETATCDGEIPKPLAIRELSDIAHEAGTTCGDILNLLAENNLITIDGTTVTVDDYARWQTTRDEIETRREAARSRKAAARERRKNRTATPNPNPENTHPNTAPPPGPPDAEPDSPAAGGQADETGEQTHNGDPRGQEETDNTMGLYDDTVPPYSDLRNTHDLPRKKTPTRNSGTIDPKYAEDVETVAQHILETRKTYLGAGQRARIGPTWRRKILTLLKGDTPDGTSFTPGQLCDLFDFAAQDEFWRGPVNDPNGLARNAHKLWVRGDYVAWSIDNGKPETHRPKGVKPAKHNTPPPGDINEDWTTVQW